MSLLSILPKKEQKQYFLTLGVEEHHVRAAIVEVTGSKVEVLGIGESDFSEGTNETEASDIAISMAEKELPEDVLVENTIFAIPQIYLDNNQVKPEYSVRLKKISKDLNLKAYGFIEYANAISFLLEKEESAPPTVLLLELTKKNLLFSHIRVGKIQQNIAVDRTDSIINDFNSALPQFTSEILPSRIIIYDDAEKIEDIKEELLKFPWHKHSIFLHTPKIEIFPTKKILTAIVEMVSTSFIFEVDHAKLGEKMPKAQVPVPGKEESFGFVQKDLQEKKEEETLSVKTPLKTDQFSIQKLFNQFSSTIKKINSSLPQLAPFPKLNSKLFVFVAVSIVLLLVITASIIVYYPKSHVFLYIYPQKQNQTIDVVFAKEGGTSLSANSIKISEISEEISGEKIQNTTGKNQIGDKAKGEVVIYNKTLLAVTFSKGTILQNSNLKFSLDDDISVASASDTGEGLSFGKTNAKITAVNIGQNSNLVTGSTFTIKDFPETSYTAKNNQTLTGGTSRDVRSVSKEDQTNLEEKLTQELINQVKSNLMQKISSKDKLIDDSVKTEVVSKKFSADVAAEAAEVNLQLNLKITGLVYNYDDLLTLAKNTPLAVPDGFQLDSQATSAQIEKMEKEKNSEFPAKVMLTYFFLPHLNIDQIKSKLTGKTYEQAASFLQENDKIAGIKIVEKNRLPVFGKKLPYSPYNIELAIAML